MTSGGATTLAPLSEIEARRLTNEINRSLTVTWDLVITAYERRVWEPLGYGSWDSYCRAEFGTARLRLPAEERAETVHSLREAGLSVRAIAAATGESKSGIGRDIEGVPGGTPVRGQDGKTYSSFPRSTQAEQLGDAVQVERDEPTPSTSPAPRRPALIGQIDTAGYELRKAIDKVARLLADDRVPTNREQVTRSLRGHLLHVAAGVDAALGEMSNLDAQEGT